MPSLLADSSSPATANIDGRVTSASTSGALSNVLVSASGTSRQTVTDDNGSFQLTVPAGQATVTATYLGFAPQSTTVTVAAGATAHVDLALRVDGGTPPANEVVKLKEFTVVEDSQMTAQAVATNVRRNAPSITDVVSMDEYGDRSMENIGDFLQFLPGVAIGNSGSEASSISLRGFPSNYTDITIDNGYIAGGRNTNSRTIDLRAVPMNNLSRVEITKEPTPDRPASTLGGTINLVSRSGFESDRPKLTYNVYTMFHNRMGINFDDAPVNELPGTSPRRVEPSFDLSLLYPINKHFALSFGAARTWREKPMETGNATDETASWNLTNLFQRQSQWNSLAQITQTVSGQIGFDWRIGDHDTVSARFQDRHYQLYTSRSVYIWNYGTGATGGSDYTQGSSAANGTVTQEAGPDQLPKDDARIYTLAYRHRGEDWKVDLTSYYSTAGDDGSDLAEGHFYQTNATISNLVIRGDQTPSHGGIIPTHYTATTSNGTPVGLFNGGNYVISTAQSDQYDNMASRVGAHLNVTREFNTGVPISVMAGAALDHSSTDDRAWPATWTFSPNGATDNASKLAGNFDVFDPAYDADGPNVFGQPVTWISNRKMYELYEAHPSWFVLNAPSAWQSYVASSTAISELISAAFVRSDVRLFHNRLWIVGGVRFERTDDRGAGPLNDPNAEYQRNADGSFLLNSAGQKVLINTDSLSLAHLQYVDRGSHAKADYDGFYPSLNARWHILDDLDFRAAFARTLGRPNLSSIVPGTTISAPTATVPTITVHNTRLKPWTANSFDFSLESYQIKDGVAAIGYYHKDISNFFGSVSSIATQDTLDRYGLGGDPSLIGYTLTTQTNAGSASINGYEAEYRQTFAFLPSWFGKFQLFGNATRLQLTGTNTADFTGFNPKTFAAGASYFRSRFFLKVTVNYTGNTRQAAQAVNAANGIPAGTYAYQAASQRWGASAQYSLNKHVALYTSVANIGGFVQNLQIYAPNTPDFAKPQRRQQLGYYSVIGLRGSF